MMTHHSPQTPRTRRPVTLLAVMFCAVLLALSMTTELSASTDKSAGLRTLIHRVAKEEGLKPSLVEAVVAVESAYNNFALSPKGAAGLMQLMPGTALDLGVGNRFDPAANVRGGARYLRGLILKYRDLRLALAAYNAGPGAVDRYGGIPPFTETQDYVRKVLHLYRNDQQLFPYYKMSLRSGEKKEGGGKKPSLPPGVAAPNLQADPTVPAHVASLAATVKSRGTFSRQTASPREDAPRHIFRFRSPTGTLVLTDDPNYLRREQSVRAPAPLPRNATVKLSGQKESKKSAEAAVKVSATGKSTPKVVKKSRAKETTSKTTGKTPKVEAKVEEGVEAKNSEVRVAVR